MLKHQLWERYGVTAPLTAPAIAPRGLFVSAASQQPRPVVVWGPHNTYSDSSPLGLLPPASEVDDFRFHSVQNPEQLVSRYQDAVDRNEFDMTLRMLLGPAYLNVGAAWLLQGRLQEAYEALEEAEVHLQRASLMLGEPFGPAHIKLAGVYYNFSIVLWASGHPDDAINCLSYADEELAEVVTPKDRESGSFATARSAVDAMRSFVAAAR